MDHNQVVNPLFTAGRGEAFSAGAQRQQRMDEIQALAELDGVDFRLPLDHRIEENLSHLAGNAADLETPIAPDNVGYKLLQKLGWHPGAGLGRTGHGMRDPVPIASTENGIRLGLGRAEIDKQFYAADNISRRVLETEALALENEEQARKREIEAQRTQRIRNDVSEALSTFFCEVCQKQYTTAMELESHLSSYAHHHKKRLAEAAAEAAERGKKERLKKERKAAVKEQARLEAQIRAVQGDDLAKEGNESAEQPVAMNTQVVAQDCSPLAIAPQETGKEPHVVQNNFLNEENTPGEWLQGQKGCFEDLGAVEELSGTDASPCATISVPAVIIKPATVFAIGTGKNSKVAPSRGAAKKSVFGADSSDEED